MIKKIPLILVMVMNFTTQSYAAPSDGSSKQAILATASTLKASAGVIGQSLAELNSTREQIKSLPVVFGGRNHLKRTTCQSLQGTIQGTSFGLLISLSFIQAWFNPEHGAQLIEVSETHAKDGEKIVAEINTFSASAKAVQDDCMNLTLAATHLAAATVALSRAADLLEGLANDLKN